MMTPERYKQVGEIYRAVLELEPEHRIAYIERACQGDDALRREVESLLEYEDEADQFIETPAVQLMASKIVQTQRLLRVGDSLSRYRIVSELGIGGMGEVYLAEDTQLGRQIALKVLPGAFTHHRDRLKRFQIEARAAGALNHPNIATVHSVEEDDGQYFITMEYVEGQPLSEVIPAEGMDLDTFFDLFIPLSDALAHAHEKGIIHRDIKPTNIIVTPDGVPKILDFGLARITKNDTGDGDDAKTQSLTRFGEIMGTPAYMSPEQAEGQRVDHRSDIFSFGVLMYEAITGQRPFKGSSYASVISSLLKEEPEPISEIRPETPYLLSRLVKQCLSKDRRRRYQAMREVSTILKEAKAQVDSGIVLRVTRTDRSRKTPIFRLGMMLALLFIAVAIIGPSIWWTMRFWRADSKPVARFSILPPPGQQRSLTEAQISPDGKHVVFASRRGELTQLYIRPLDQFDSRPIAGTEGAVRPFFSPDSQWIGFYQSDNRLKKVRVSGGAPLTICENCRMDYESYWGEDDTIIASDTTGLYRIPAGGGSLQRLTEVDVEAGEKSHRAPQTLPGGKRVLFTVNTLKEQRIALLSLETGEWRYLMDEVEGSMAQYVPTGHIVFTRSNQLMAVPFNLDRLEITGPATAVLDGLFGSQNFRVASNGTLIYLPDTAMRENTLVWVDRSGQMSQILPNRANYRTPRLSPDGKRVVVQVESDIWVYEVESGRGIRLTFEGENQSPIWTPDGKGVVFASQRNNLWSLYRKAADIGSEAELLLQSEYRHVPYSWHPSGKSLALVAMYGSNNSDVVILSLQGNRATPFLTSPFIEDTPCFSPDGRWISYFSMESGRAEVYVQPYPGPGAKMPVSKGGGMYPIWSGSGREILFRQGGKISTVDVKTTPEFSAGAPRTLFEGRFLTGYDVARDGRRFLMVANEQGAWPSHLNVILNWTEELKRLVPVK
ncbi:MAG TPA: protein kinase [Blastocatellia bacterium]|nr:protein kinase [Blastocatellia bacterium]